MKTILVVLFLITIVTSAVMFQSCSNTSPTAPVTNNNDSCGGLAYLQYQSSTPFTQRGFPETYTLGSERYYDFFYKIDSICTDKHVSCNFSAVAINVPARPIKFTAAIEWQVFWEERDTGAVTINGNVRGWSAKIEDLGLKVPFGEGAATVFANIYVHFPTLGSAQQDSVFLINNLSYVDMVFNYSYHKPSSAVSGLEQERYNGISYIFNDKRPSFDQSKFQDLFYDNSKAVIISDHNIF
jgi:hypothetical protein